MKKYRCQVTSVKLYEYKEENESLSKKELQMLEKVTIFRATGHALDTFQLCPF